MPAAEGICKYTINRLDYPEQVCQSEVLGPLFWYFTQRPLQLNPMHAYSEGNPNGGGVPRIAAASYRGFLGMFYRQVLAFSICKRMHTHQVFSLAALQVSFALEMSAIPSRGL